MDVFGCAGKLVRVSYGGPACSGEGLRRRILRCRREVSGGYGIGGAEESGNPLSGRAACRIYCRRRRGGMR